MALDKWIALIIFLICCLYGYTAFITMEANLLPFELNMSFLPNSLPKILSVAGALTALVILLQPGKQEPVSAGEIDYRKLTSYKLGQAVSLLIAMILYALLLRPFGFLFATFMFLGGGAFILGERKYHWMIIAAGLGSFVVWYLSDQVLGIFLKPLPWFM